MKPSVATIFWPADVPVSVNYGLLAFASITIIGVLIIALGALAIGHAQLSGARSVISSGLLVLALGPLVGGLIMLRDWHHSSHRVRIGAIVLILAGISALVVCVNAMLNFMAKG
jgi:hypothetical protein